MHFPDTFEAWLLQRFGRDPLPEGTESVLRHAYESSRAAVPAHDVRYMSSKPCPAGQYRYAVAIEEGGNLWLTLWVKRDPRACYVLYPRGPGAWNPHASYHRDGRYHHKSHNVTLAPPQKRQPLDRFRGAEHLGTFQGHGVGTAICDPVAFTSVLRVPLGILEPMRGCVLVDLVEPGVSWRGPGRGASRRIRISGRRRRCGWPRGSVRTARYWLPRRGLR